MNELVMLDIQNRDNSEGESEPYSDEYTYLGGFTGIRGDIEFSLSDDALILIFNQNYSEFINGFSATTISIPFTALKDILAFQQRFDSEKSLFTTPLVNTYNNYLNPEVVPHREFVEIIDQTIIMRIINPLPDLNPRFQAILDSIRASDQKLIDQAVQHKVKEVDYKLTVVTVGPYLNINRFLYTGEKIDYYRVSYKPDGSVLTFADVFRAGFDYQSVVIEKMKQLATDHGYIGVYDYEAIVKTMKIMVTDDGIHEHVRIFNYFIQAPAANDGEFDVFLDFKDYPSDILIKPWLD